MTPKCFQARTRVEHWVAASLMVIALAGPPALAWAAMGDGTENRQWVAGPAQAPVSPAQYQVITPTEVDGSPSQLFAGGEQSSTDQRLDESHILTWTTPSLTSPTEVTGPVTVNFWASSTASDTDFAAHLVDVAPDGTARQISGGRVKATHYPDEANPRPLVPGEIYQLAIEIWPTSRVFDTDHRIRLELSSSEVPLMSINPNPAIDTIYHDAAHPSHVVLPIIGTSSLLAGGYETAPADPLPSDLWAVVDGTLDTLPTGDPLPY